MENQRILRIQDNSNSYESISLANDDVNELLGIVAVLEATIKLTHENLTIWLNDNKKHICMGEPQRKMFVEIVEALKGN